MAAEEEEEEGSRGQWRQRRLRARRRGRVGARRLGRFAGGRQRWHGCRPDGQRPVRAAAPVDDRRLGASEGRVLRHDHSRADGGGRMGAGERVPDRRQHLDPRGRRLRPDAVVHDHRRLLHARLRQRSVSGARDGRCRRRDRLRLRGRRRLPPDRRAARAEASVRDVAREHHGHQRRAVPRRLRRGVGPRQAIRSDVAWKGLLVGGRGRLPDDRDAGDV